MNTGEDAQSAVAPCPSLRAPPGLQCWGRALLEERRAALEPRLGPEGCGLCGVGELTL